MTDKFPPLSTQFAHPSQPSAAPLPNGTPAPTGVPKTENVGEEEPYTIKCICDFAGDDGSTIYCEGCDTWQHIECYYPDTIEDAYRENFAHWCVDCKPRPIDKQKAIQRQRRRLEASAAANTAAAATSVIEEQATDKKPKRPPATKSHKKKPKQPQTEAQTPNGGHGPTGNDHGKHSLSHDHGGAPPAKKTKTSHKASHSVSSQAAKRSPPYGNGRNAHPPSPATTPPEVSAEFNLHTPNVGFVTAYNDHSVSHVTSNSFASLTVSATLAAWPRDPARMKRDVDREPKDVFRPSPPKQPCHQLRVELDTISLSGGTMVHLKYLTTPVAINKDEPLIELNGSIEFQKDYCARPENRWDQLTFPLPFVFFHDTLPLCIDTREEGSEARYVRRSCRPTARLETYLDPGNTALYHFMLFADRDIKPGEQITLPWDFRLPKETQFRWRKLLGLDLEEEDASKPVEPQPDDLIQLREFVPTLLGEYGGCACKTGTDCAFSRFFRNLNGKVHAPSRPQPPKKRSRAKSKAQATTSPTSTGHATNSRAASEGHADDVTEHDGRSVSGAARSKPPSRDRTPAPGRSQPSESYGMLTAEPTEREKRKAAAFEENIRRTEEQKPKKKKPRVSDGPTPSAAKPKAPKRGTAESSTHTSAHPSSTSRHYVDAATSRTKSDSPGPTSILDGKSHARDTKSTQTPRPIPVVSKPVYVEQGTQTDFALEWYLQKPESQPRRRVVSLAKRLMQNRHRQKAENSSRETSPAKCSTPTSPASVEATDVVKVESPTSQKSPSEGCPAPAAASNPTVPASPARIAVPEAATASGVKAPDAPEPARSQLMRSPSKLKMDLKVQMPPVPSFNGPSSAMSTPISASGSVNSPISASHNLPSPLPPLSVNGVAHPSPVRKKLSLSDYRKSRNMTSAATKPPGGFSGAGKAGSVIEESKGGGGISKETTTTTTSSTSPTIAKGSEMKPGSTTAAATAAATPVVATTNGSL